jgi:predicted nucleic acid-binding protein
MVYVDTSVIIALHLNEPRSADVAHWYAGCTDELVSAHWCATEFASVLSIKQRTGQIDASAARAAWQRFERQCANDLQLMPVEPAVFHRAAALASDPAIGLGAGNALHVAAALDCKAKSLATLDEALARIAAGLKLKLSIR